MKYYSDFEHYVTLYQHYGFNRLDLCFIFYYFIYEEPKDIWNLSSGPPSSSDDDTSRQSRRVQTGRRRIKLINKHVQLIYIYIYAYKSTYIFWRFNVANCWSDKVFSRFITEDKTIWWLSIRKFYFGVGLDYFFPFLISIVFDFEIKYINSISRGFVNEHPPPTQLIPK